MELIQQKTVSCPYCGEAIDIQIDCSVHEQRYVEDCSVCCRPMDVQINGQSGLDVTVKRQDD